MRTSAKSFFYGVNMKTAKTIDEQLEILMSRGIKIGDYDEAYSMLENVNYYTLTGYLFPFKNGEVYKDNITMELAINLYKFDNVIRNILTSLIVEAEEKLKTRIAYQIAINHPDDPLIYTDVNYFKNSNDHSRLMSEFQNNIRNNRTVPFVRHHIVNYRGQFPIWVAVNLFTLGNIKYLYKNIPSKDRKNISKTLNVSPLVLDSWIDTLRILRNKLAHNMRLYDSTFHHTPKFEKQHEYKPKTNRLFFNFVLMKYLLGNSDTWVRAINNLEEAFEQYNEYIELDVIGFPYNWAEILNEI